MLCIGRGRADAAAGVPLVASDIDGYRAVRPETAGRLVPPGDPAALAELLADDSLRARMGESGRRESARYAWPRIAERTLAVYERVTRLSRPDAMC